MQEIKCPHCGERFELDESSLGDIMNQIRNNEFEKEIAKRESVLKMTLDKDIELAKANAESVRKSDIAKKDEEISRLQSEIESVKMQGRLDVQNEKSINAGLAAQLDEIQKQIDTEKKLAVSEAVAQAQQEIGRLSMLLEQEKQASARQEQSLTLQYETDKKLAVSEAVRAIEKERDELIIKAQTAEKEKLENERQLKEQYEEKIRDRDEQIGYLKDFKSRLSTKMVGESLEQHCENEFNKLRATAFPSAYFEKDNDSRLGSKGDFIFRETDTSGAELVSIMFEMKNEMETTATKKRNEDFFKELDKDRNEKNCEYAVLVSMLEADSELYNQGIVDVSYRYPKMYVIRPQFFIPMITLLRNASLNSLQYKRQLIAMQQQEYDITDFEERINDFKDKFGRDYRLASEKFTKAIEEIDKSIEYLEKVKKDLLSSENHLRLANNKAEELTIRKLTRGNSTMEGKFRALRQEKGNS